MRFLKRHPLGANFGESLRKGIVITTDPKQDSSGNGLVVGCRWAGSGKTRLSLIDPGFLPLLSWTLWSPIWDRQAASRRPRVESVFRGPLI